MVKTLRYAGLVPASKRLYNPHCDSLFIIRRADALLEVGGDATALLSSKQSTKTRTVPSLLSIPEYQCPFQAEFQYA